MKIVRLEAENFKILKAIQITPDGNIVTIGGNNDQGKSSILDAIWVALAGKAVAPAKPIRTGEEECRILLDVGEYVITRKFRLKEDGQFTDSVKVESGDGTRRFNSPQGVLDALMGQIGFDPFAFVKLKPDAQAELLLEMVPLPIDLEDLAQQDAADMENRRDLNREIRTLDGQIAGIPERTDLGDVPDRTALMNELATAADKNGEIERERARRDSELAIAIRLDAAAEDKRRDAQTRRDQAAQLINEAETLEAAADEDHAAADAKRKDVMDAPALQTPVNTEELRAKLTEADQLAGLVEGQRRRASLIAERDEKQAKSDAYTKALDDRESARQQALTEAKMPIDGLAFQINEKGKPVVLYKGVPFDQAGTAVKIRASTAIAMAANPELRVLRISDGSLLDENSMRIIAEMAEAEDFQLWIEVVGTGGVGVVIENGMVKGAELPEPTGKKAAGKAKAADKPETLL